MRRTLIYHSDFRDAIAQIHNQLPKVKTFIEVNGTEVASFAENYETLATRGDGAPLGIERSPDDELFIYTGGTTGMPKGVIYRHGDLMQLWLNRVERLTRLHAAVAGGVQPTGEDVAGRAAGACPPVRRCMARD
ncbi:MAG: AMP-binding protein [Rhizomicrobium sp.]